MSQPVSNDPAIVMPRVRFRSLDAMTAHILATSSNTRTETTAQQPGARGHEASAPADAGPSRSKSGSEPDAPTSRSVAGGSGDGNLAGPPHPTRATNGESGTPIAQDGRRGAFDVELALRGSYNVSLVLSTVDQANELDRRIGDEWAVQFLAIDSERVIILLGRDENHVDAITSLVNITPAGREVLGSNNDSDLLVSDDSESDTTIESGDKEPPRNAVAGQNDRHIDNNPAFDEGLPDLPEREERDLAVEGHI
ncbi:hypothetical protein DFP72DRAFT_1078927 [Ephemerocybe angulata]|uniref:Uncharacterized protein n=1 Tax=Ephemerocybe angulata TaxID=980116 RepID=A0A8H6HDM9_9AGAR|nr:hypothetical protein DFP72DRAFT_1078927 [Tulosesus angulatus]